jgi:hypothetical protein
MLNEEQIKYCYYTQQKHFINKNNSVVRMCDNRLAFYGLLTNNGRLTAISNNPMSIRALVGSNTISLYSFYTNESVKYPDDYDIVVEKNKCWEFVKNNNGWFKNLSIQTTEELYNYILTTQKIAILDKIHNYIDHNRKPITQKLMGQDLVYTSKYLEAKEVIDKKIECDTFLNYPFVSGYAETMGILIQESAKQIITQYELQSCVLADSENLRIKYTNIIRKEKNIENLKEILNSFYTEGHGYSSL